MKLGLLKTLIILNILIIVVSLAVIYFRYSELSNKPEILIKENKQSFQQGLNVKETEKSTPTVTEQLLFTSQKKLRKPKFVYFSSKAKKVALIGDFNNWVPVTMNKVSSSKWELTVEIPEGRYLYNFLVDGKIMLDPNNKQTELSKEGFKSSVLELK
ncbi:MAG: glycogen-binding domain-containing protein [Endomicrobiia bacterium]